MGLAPPAATTRPPGPPFNINTCPPLPPLPLVSGEEKKRKINRRRRRRERMGGREILEMKINKGGKGDEKGLNTKDGMEDKMEGKDRGEMRYKGRKGEREKRREGRERKKKKGRWE